MVFMYQSVGCYRATSIFYERAFAGVQPKNILLLVIDDLRPALGSYDYPKILSPNINQLASLSVQFNNAHVQVSMFDFIVVGLF